MILIKYTSYLDASFVIIKENKRKNLIKCLCLMHVYSCPKEYVNNSLFIYWSSVFQTEQMLISKTRILYFTLLNIP